MMGPGPFFCFSHICLEQKPIASNLLYLLPWTICIHFLFTCQLADWFLLQG